MTDFKADITADVITMDGAHERLAHVERLKQRLFEHGIDLLRWKATTPATLPKIKVDYLSFNSTTEIACLYSHLALIQHRKENAAKVSLIFEDDALLHDQINFKALIASAPADWEILTLGTSNPSYYLQFQFLLEYGGPKWLTWNRNYWGAFAYILRDQAREKLCRRFWKEENTLDLSGLFNPFGMVADDVIFSSARTYVSCFPWAIHDAGFASSIQFNKSEALRATNLAFDRVKKIWSLVDPATMGPLEYRKTT
jgi:GR25 family glycosyltransferase involved in LPS biosynthesis